MRFQVDLPGRVKNVDLPPSKALHPVFEAISNSFHAVEDCRNGSGAIEIEIVRSGGDLLEAGEASSFKIRDNGVGFTDENFQSFGLSDSTYKQSRGGKGVGRLLWLKAFSRVEVASSYVQGGASMRRDFTFALPEGVSGGEQPIPRPPGPVTTEVSLIEFLHEYRERCPRAAQTIATHLLEHFALVFISDRCPRVDVIDGGERISVNGLRSSLLVQQPGETELEVAGHNFSLLHFHNYGNSSNADHLVCLCGNGRVVKSEHLHRISSSTPTRRITEIDTGRSFYYVGLVSGPALDQSTNAVRTNFSLDDADTGLPGVLTIDALGRAVCGVVEQHLAPHLKPLRDESEQRVERFIRSRAPQYLPLLRDRTALQVLPPDLTDDSKIDQHLRRLQFQKETELSNRAEELQRRTISVEDYPTYKDEVLRFFDEETEYGRSALARYVIHRKVVIDLLDRLLGRLENGSFALEELIHRIVCPHRITSEDQEFTKHNLWLVDERLAFHSFLASNRGMRDQDGQTQVPDVMVFDVGMAFTDSDSDIPGSVVLIEFKRPQRDDYTTSHNPMEQVSEYIMGMREREWRDNRGRTIRVNDNTQFYCYIICDPMPTLERLATKDDWSLTPDGEGYYKFVKNLKAYMEIISYKKLITDSRKRNRVLFDSLGLGISLVPVQKWAKSARCREGISSLPYLPARRLSPQVAREA